MGVKTRIDPIDRDIQLMIDDALSPDARSREFAAAAKTALAETDDINRQILGRIPRSHTFVDGSEGRPLSDVRPDGVIVREYELITEVLKFIADDLLAHSPIGRSDLGDKHPGLYKKSHTLFADSAEVPIGDVIPNAEEYVFINTVPYARKLELGSSLQWNNIYQGTASAARARFSNIAKISFSYRGIVGGEQLRPSGSITRIRERGGRFASEGGSRAQNVSAVRFPAIIVRNY